MWICCWWKLQDVLQIKAALQGIRGAFSSTGQRRRLDGVGHMETTGTMLVGQISPAVVANFLSLSRIDILGLNCGHTALKQMKEACALLECAQSVCGEACIPNAACPKMWRRCPLPV